MLYNIIYIYFGHVALELKRLALHFMDRRDVFGKLWRGAVGVGDHLTRCATRGDISKPATFAGMGRPLRNIIKKTS